MPSKAGEEVRKDETMSEEVTRDRGLEASEHEAVEVEYEGEEAGEVHPFTPLTTINNPPKPSFFEIHHILSYPVFPTSSSSRYYTQYHPQNKLLLDPLRRSLPLVILKPILSSKTYNLHH